MTSELVQAPSLWPILIYFLITVFIIGAMLGLPYVLGQRRRVQATNEPFESGILPAGNSDVHLRFSVPFYLLAIFFVIFDLEAVFIFAWAISFREVGWAGYIEMLIFIGVLVAALVYLWVLGALDWRTRRQKVQESKVRW